MLKATFGAVKSTCSRTRKRQVFVSSVISSVRQYGTSRIVLNRNTDRIDMRHMHKPKQFEKYILVIAGVYKKPSDVPDRVSHEQLRRAYDLSRGRTMIAMVFFWTGMLYLAIRHGRRLRDAGVSLEEEGIKQIAAWKEQGRLEREAQMKKSE